MSKIKAGDIFEVPLSNGKKQYIQFIFKNLNELGGDLIRAYDFELEKNEEVNTKELISKPIKFYCHGMLLLGIKLAMWSKIGNEPIEPNFEEPTFRGADEVYSMTKKSYKWYLKKGADVKWIGELKEEYKKLPKAGVTPPIGVVRQLETGWDGFVTPE
ncbi:MAG TPA: Imm26 family immunity protein [Bacteroidia bacterium]|jgi:hypothetical protein